MNQAREEDMKMMAFWLTWIAMFSGLNTPCGLAEKNNFFKKMQLVLIKSINCGMRSCMSSMRSKTVFVLKVIVFYRGILTTSSIE